MSSFWAVADHVEIEYLWKIRAPDILLNVFLRTNRFDNRIPLQTKC